MALADDKKRSADGAKAGFTNMAQYLDWKVIDTIIAENCGDIATLKYTDYLNVAYELGKNL